MAAFLLRFFPLFMISSAYASEPQDLPPQAGAAGVIVFVLLFVGICVGFFAYLWWKEKKSKPGDK